MALKDEIEIILNETYTRHFRDYLSLIIFTTDPKGDYADKNAKLSESILAFLDKQGLDRHKQLILLSGTLTILIHKIIKGC
jgi:hypothetical protein